MSSRVKIKVEYLLHDKVVVRYFYDFHRLNIFIDRCLVDSIPVKVIRVS